MAVFWLTGMPCSGKTTIGRALVERLGELGRVACLIDGDVVRRGELSHGLGFSATDRLENVRRVAGLAARLAAISTWWWRWCRPPSGSAHRRGCCPDW